MAYVCEECGSDKVQTLAWVDFNTDQYVSEGPGGTEDNWCPVCMEHINIISEKDYKENQDESR